MSESSKHQDLIAGLLIQLRITSANSVMHSQVIADRVGIHSTDNECLDFLLLNGPSSAGQLAVLTGLTTGAVTAMIDRLEKAGFVERQHEKSDRRRVLVVPKIEKIMAEVAPHSVRMGEAMIHLFGEFSDAELETVLRFTRRANEISAEVIAALRKDG
jgi:DNA-binding MarR family transcriptional regulator